MVFDADYETYLAGGVPLVDDASTYCQSSHYIGDFGLSETKAITLDVANVSVAVIDWLVVCIEKGT